MDIDLTWLLLGILIGQNIMLLAGARYLLVVLRLVKIQIGVSISPEVETSAQSPDVIYLPSTLRAA